MIIEAATGVTLFVVSGSGSNVYEMAQALVERIDDQVLRLRVDPQVFRAGLEHGALTPGQEVAFELRLTDGTPGLTGSGTLLSAQVSANGHELKLHQLRLQGRGAVIVAAMMAAAREARRASLAPRSPSPSAVWDEDTLAQKA